VEIYPETSLKICKVAFPGLRKKYSKFGKKFVSFQFGVGVMVAARCSGVNSVVAPAVSL